MRAIVILIRLPFVLVLNSLAFLRWGCATLFYRFFELFRRRDLYVRVSLEEGLRFGRERSGLAKYLDRSPTFLQIRRDLKRAAGRDEVAGFIIQSKGAQLGRARAGELADLLGSLRESGKKLYATSELATTTDYIISSAADDVTMAPSGRLYTFAPRIEQLFFTPLLAKLGVTAQFVHIGAYKTGYNRFVMDEPSPGDAAMTAELRDKLDDVTRRRVARSRQMNVDDVAPLFRDAPLDPRRAKRLGFIDAEVFSRDITRYIEQGDEHMQKPSEYPLTPRSVSLSNFIDRLPKEPNFRRLSGRKHRLAVVDLTGMIVMPRTNIPGASKTIDPDDVVPALESVKNGSYDGLIIHINSPGGSAIASDIIWHAIDEVRAQIPVVAYCSDVAGSGGYYLAVGADQIVCRPESIVGSIGVITGKISAQGALDKVGVKPAVYEAPDAPAPMMSLVEPFSDEALENVKDEAREFYRRFLHRVGVARRLEKRRLHRYARGRVYLGEAALRRGLVDSIGGFEEAISRLEELVQSEPGDASLHFVSTHEETLAEALRSQLKPSLQAVAEETVGTSMVQTILEPLVMRTFFERESTLALMDRVVITDRQI